MCGKSECSTGDSIGHTNSSDDEGQFLTHMKHLQFPFMALTTRQNETQKIKLGMLYNHEFDPKSPDESSENLYETHGDQSKYSNVDDMYSRMGDKKMQMNEFHINCVTSHHPNFTNHIGRCRTGSNPLPSSLHPPILTPVLTVSTTSRSPPETRDATPNRSLHSPTPTARSQHVGQGWINRCINGIGYFYTKKKSSVFSAVLVVILAFMALVYGVIVGANICGGRAPFPFNYIGTSRTKHLVF